MLHVLTGCQASACKFITFKGHRDLLEKEICAIQDRFIIIAGSKMSHVCLAQELLLDLYSNLITFVCMFEGISLRL